MRPLEDDLQVMHALAGLKIVRVYVDTRDGRTTIELQGPNRVVRLISDGEIRLGQSVEIR